MLCVTITQADATTTQTTGSEGSISFLNTSTSGGALEGNIGTADTTYTSPFGLLGVDNSAANSTVGIGVVGISTTGVAIGGSSFSSTSPSLEAYPAGNGPGIEAFSQAASGADAIYAEAMGTGNAIVGISDKASGSGLEGISSTGGSAYVGLSTGEGISAYGSSKNTQNPAIAAFSTNGGDLFGTFNSTANISRQETVSITSGTSGRSGHELAGGSDLNVSGDIFVYGKIYQDCVAFPVTANTTCLDVQAASTQTTMIAHSSRGDVQMYGSRQTAPSVEDVGSSRLNAGRSFVRLDPAFAATMSQAKPYMVFLTPHGSSRGMYVTNVSPNGFEVAENENGRSTLDFDYRIVGTPIGEESARLARAEPTRKEGERPESAAVLKEESARKASFHKRYHVQPIVPTHLETFSTK